MTWRRLRPGETDHEALWLSVSLASLALAGGWLFLALPCPPCPFHQVTGWPCPSCGVTRCLRLAFHDDWVAAAVMNPLAFLGFGLIALFDLYAATVLLLRWPRWRCENLAPRTARCFRFLTITLILGNWLWLCYRRV